MNKGYADELLANDVSAVNQLGRNEYVTFYLQKDAEMNILFVGNSITKHAPKSDIGWSSDWGMAASAEKMDYVHLIINELIKKYGAVNYCIAQAAEWERNYTSDTVLDELYISARAFYADIVIIRIGENINCEKIKTITFKPYFDRMVKFFSSNPKSKVIVSDLFWRSAVIDAPIMEVIKENKYTYAEIGDLNNDDKYKAKGLFEHKGVQLHPGDLGMKAISNRILKAIEEAFKSC